MGSIDGNRPLSMAFRTAGCVLPGMVVSTELSMRLTMRGVSGLELALWPSIRVTGMRMNAMALSNTAH
jgi:hypothetical protein